MAKPIAVDLFAGCGGLSLGLKHAGFDVRVAVERQKQHAEIHLLNFPDCPVLSDIYDVTGDQLLDLAGSEIDLIAGGPPCQGFSSEGKRSISDERSLLVYQFFRIVKEVRPKYFLFENVPTITDKRFRNVFRSLLMEFYALGYLTTHKVVNAKTLGVPQNRERLIIIGSLAGTAVPFPEPMAFTPTVWDAIGDLPEPISYENDELSIADFFQPSYYASSLRDADVVGGFLKTQHKPDVAARFAAAEPGKKEKISRFFKLHSCGLSCTLKAGTTGEHGSHTAARPIHPFSPRVITVREAARLHSYPDSFRFHPSKHWGFMEVGNSVPPFMAKAIGAEILLDLARL